MAGDCGLNALSLLPENVLPQWQQKIANAENSPRPIQNCVRMDFLRICAIFCRYWTCSFSCRNNQAIGPRLSAIFTLFLFPYFVCQMAMGTSHFTLEMLRTSRRFVSKASKIIKKDE